MEFSFLEALRHVFGAVSDDLNVGALFLVHEQLAFGTSQTHLQKMRGKFPTPHVLYSFVF